MVKFFSEFSTLECINMCAECSAANPFFSDYTLNMQKAKVRKNETKVDRRSPETRNAAAINIIRIYV